MRRLSVDQSLSDEELDQLSDFLKGTGSSTLNLEAVDGLFCALICGPETVPHSEYLPEIWGEDFVFDNREDVSRIMGLLLRHWNTIAYTLLGTLTMPDVYMPILFVDDDGLTKGNDWARGFMRGTLMRSTFWRELMESDEHGGLLLPMMLLSHERDPDPSMRPLPVPSEKREDILSQMIASLTKIYRHFEPLRRAMPRGFQAPTPSQHRTAAKIGRNDTCPCGSGKKYKRCCAMTPPTVH